MASYTPNLDLLKKSPVTDGDDMFNVETMLNENWDRIDRGVGDYTTPAQKMGLTGDLSVGASLGVLANIGNVHVWRKTVTTEEEIPAGYTLGPVQNSNIDIFGGYSNYNVTERGVWRYSKTISVDANGTISLDNYSLLDVESTWSGNNNDAYVAKQCLSGSFAICIDAPTGWDSENIHPLYPPIVGKVYFFPDDIEVLDIERPDTSGYLEVAANKYQEVTSNPYVPAGTHITYLTSTNRNAYQEGDDAKEAGYVLGRIVKVTLGMSNTNDGTGVDWRYSDSVTVTPDGVVSLGGSPTQLILAGWSDPEECEVLKGKFACPVTTGSRFSTNEVVFFPNDTVFSKSSVSGGHVAINAEQYQIVTGYPAIPAGTTIEYLGVLGNKTIIETGSYVGTGTYGKANPQTLTFNFDVKFFVLQGHDRNNYQVARIAVKGSDLFGSSSATNSTGLVTWNGSTVSWYGDDAPDQGNKQGSTYYYVALG